MLTLDNVADVREQVMDWRESRLTCALVPTMGNLHAGHLALIRDAANLADRVVVSIFVNPLQFGPDEDFAAYPRTEDADREQLLGAGVHVLFRPRAEAIYPRGPEHSAYIDIPELTSILCGAARPGHFRGVATVVTKLLNIVQPDVAVFGQKDYQQLTVIRRVVADLCMPVRIVGGETIREDDGLAMSSRNRYLTPAERETAPALHQALLETAASLKEGEQDFKRLEEIGFGKLNDAGFNPDYYAIRAGATLEPAEPATRDLIVLAAGWLGRARLIDNVAVTVL